MTKETIQEPQEKRLISRQDAAEMIGCSGMTISNWIEKGAIKARLIGHNLYVDKRSVEMLLDTASDVAEMEEELKKLKKQLSAEILKKKEEVLDLRKDNEYNLQKRFLQKVFDCLITKARNYLSPKETRIAIELRRGDSTAEIGKKISRTSESVRHSWYKIEPILLEKFDNPTLQDENMVLREEIQTLTKDKQSLSDENNELIQKIDELEKELIKNSKHRALLSTPFGTDINSLGFSVRVTNGLMAINCKTLGDLVQFDLLTLTKAPKLGLRSVRDIEETLHNLGLRLGMDLVRMTDEEFDAHVERLNSINLIESGKEETKKK